MKKILLGILAFAAVACNNDVVVNEQTPSAITFGDSFVEVKTRGAEDPSTTTATINAFDVWGFIEQPSGTIFNQERVTRGANGWSYNNTQWWFPTKNYFFHAVSPVDDANIVVNTENMNSYGLGNIAFTNVDGTTDLLYASKHVVTDDSDPYYENASTGDKVSMQFMHLLSKIKFTFQNGFATENTTLKVTNIKIVDAPAKGNVDVNKESRLDYVWNLTQGETTTLEFGDVNGGVALAALASAECAVERLTIPADATRSYTIEFDLELFCGDESGMTSHKVVTLENQAFAIGKNYNIVAVINNENFAEEALLPIEFDVITVEEWVENNFEGNLDYDANKQPVALATPAVNATVSENTVTLAWAAVENADKYGITVGTELPVFVEETTYTFTGDYATEYTFSVVAVPADEENYAVSEAAVVTATTEAEPVVLYLNPNMWNVDGARYAAYMWNDAGNIWVSLTLAEGETSIYQFTAPAGYPNIIFCRMNPSGGNNWESKWNQTADLTVPTNGKNLYTVTGWDGSNNNQWTVYVPTPAVVALPAPVVTAEVDVNVVTLNWAAIEGASHYTVQVDDDVEEVVNTNSFTFTGDYEVEYMFTVKAIAADTTKNSDSEAAVVTATTEAEPVVAPVETVLTVAEFLALTDIVPSDATAEEIAAAPLYTLTGTITSVTNSTYGNFYLNDGTGEVLIYGLVGPNAESKYWANSGAKVGDDITVKTIRTEYNNAPQGKNATFVEVKTPGTLAFWSFDASAASFTAAGGEKTINVSIYNANSEVVVASNNAQFSAAYANGVLTIYALENTEFEAVEGEITVTCGSLSQVIGVSQAAAVASGGEEKTEVTKELSFVAANRDSWDTSKQTWKVEGVTLVNEKGSSTSAVADYVNPARFYKSSKITVTADGNITTIVFDCNSTSYATALKSSITGANVSVSSDKVTVTLDGSSNEFVIASLTGGQVRMDSMTVTYLQ